MRQFFQELKRRNVFKVGVTYAVVAFVIWQVAEIAFPALRLPEWALTLVVTFSILGFPIALVLAWAFDLTPEGVRRTIEADEGQIPAESDRSKIPVAARGFMALGLLTAVAAGGLYLIGAESGPEPSVEDRSIAVLPFENMGGGESAQFTQGVHDGLLTRLSNVSDLRVISRTSVMQYQDTALDLPAIADSLGVAWVVEGGVQQAGGQVQVNAQLIQAEEDAHQWAESYRRELTPENVFAIQSELTQEIARSLETRLSREEEERVRRQPTEDLEAYQLYVQGRQRFGRRSGECLSCIREAAEFFHQAIERDSTFALAWAGLADVAAVEEYRSPGVVPDSLLPNPERAAQRALEIDPELAEAHASMGHIHLRNQNAPAALREFQRAVELKPSYWEAHHWLGDLYWYIGERQRSLDHVRLAVELNPQHAGARHGLYDAYSATGQHEEALEEARLQQRLGLESTSAIGGEVRALWGMGRLEEARRLAEEQIAERDVETFWGRWFRAYLVGILAAQGDTVQAREYLDQLARAGASRQLGAAYRAVGETDQALNAWQRVEPEEWTNRPLSPGTLLQWAREQPEIREDPRYRELLSEVSRVWGLNPDGSLPDSEDVSFTTPSEE